MDRLSQRIQSVQAPIIPIVAEWQRNTPGTVSLGQGVVSYGPPGQVLDSIRRFSARPEENIYGPVAGIPALHQQIKDKLLAENGINCDDGYKMIVTAGSNMAFLNVMLALLDSDDEVILPLPYYFNQEMAVRLAGGKPVGVPADANFHPDSRALKEAITEKTRAIVTVSPNNPSGAVYPEQVLRDINRLCAENGLYHISDEAYEYFTYDGARHVSPASFEGAEGHTLSLFSLSKAYGFASWRIGYLILPEALYSSLLKIQDTNLICPPLINQYAAAGALTAGRKYCLEKLRPMGGIRNRVIELLGSENRLCQILPAQGAFYFLLKIPTEMDDLTLVQRLIKEYRVAAIPGSAFGMTDGCYLRISYGMLDHASCEVGISRLLEGLAAMVK